METPLIIIQARLGASRLPNKVLKTVGKWSIVELLVERLLKKFRSQDLCFAIPDTPENDILKQHIDTLRIHCIRGSENDVYQRFSKALESHGRSAFVRITADCPLLSPDLIQEGLKIFETGEYDIVHSGPKIAEGLDFEIVNTQAFFDLAGLEMKRIHREHPTLYFYENRDKYRIFDFNGENDDSGFRITLDEPRDLRVIEQVVDYFQDEAFTCSWSQIKEFLVQHPEILGINQGIIRNEGLIRDREKASN